MPRPLARRFAALLGLTALSGAGCAPRATTPASLDFTTVRAGKELVGEWVGGTNVLGSYTLIEARFRHQGAGIAGELRAPSQNVSRLPVTHADVSDSMVRFTFRSPFGTHEANARWEQGMLIGRIEGGGLSGDFHLLPVQEIGAAVTASRAGSFSEGRAHHLLLVERAGGGLAWSETEPLDDGALWIAGGSLYGYTSDTMFTDRSIRAQPRDQEWAVFGSDAIEWHPETRPPRITRRIAMPIVQEAIEFSNGDVRLAGTLLLPPGGGLHAAAVLVHGSGPAERSNLLAMARAELLLRQRIAVLLYDKRGVAGSSGEWEQASIEDLAGDAAAGVAYLRSHPRVRRDAVGLFGQSQAGWVIPAAAAREPGADFLIILSGGGVGPAEQETFRARAEAVAQGLDGDRAAALMALKWQFAATSERWDDYIAAVRAADPRIIGIVEAPTDSAARTWALPRLLARYDAARDLGAIRVPTLVVFGETDDNVPVDRAIAEWRAAVPASLLRIEALPGVGHALVEQRPGRSVFPAGLLQVLGEWIEAREWGRP
jgi:pimeloyl-ACP methyl ester carboxylesterase